MLNLNKHVLKLNFTEIQEMLVQAFAKKHLIFVNTDFFNLFCFCKTKWNEEKNCTTGFACFGWAFKMNSLCFNSSLVLFNIKLPLSLIHI